MGYKKKVTEVNLLKSYSMINQAIQLSYVDNGSHKTWGKDITNPTAHWTGDEMLNWFNKYLAPYLKYTKLETNSMLDTSSSGEEYSNETIDVYLNNGVIFRLQSFNPYDFFFVFDGGKTNKRGFDVFPMRFLDIKGTLKAEPYWADSLAAAWDGTLDGLKYAELYGCYEASRGQGMLCSKLIQENGWKIPEDYPYFK